MGNSPYNPVALLKMLLLTYLYSLSERQTEEFVNFNLPAKEFVGLAVNVAAPDHSALSVKSRLREYGCWEQFQQVSDTVLQQAREAGIQFGSMQVVDSVHTVADVDNDADRRRQDQGRPPRDPQAQLVKKGKQSIVQPDGFDPYSTYVNLDSGGSQISSTDLFYQIYGGGKSRVSDMH